MSRITSENTFETAIIQSLIETGGYSEGSASDYSPELGMFKADILQFLKETQAKQWKKLEFWGHHGILGTPYLIIPS